MKRLNKFMGIANQCP